MRRYFPVRIILIIVVVLLFLNYASTSSYDLNAFQLELDLSLSQQPATVIRFPPLGKLLAVTHTAPVRLEMTLEAIYQERLNYIIDNVESKEELLDLLSERAHEIIKDYLLRLFLITILGGAIAGLLVGISWRNLGEGVVIAALIFLLLFASTYSSYDIDKFSDPSFEGMLEAAPWMTGLIQEGINNIEELSGQLELITVNIANLFTKIEELEPLSRKQSDLKILHVSDIHNNPVALRFVLQTAESFDVDFIIDTGDITDYGTPLEGKLLEKLSELDVPYIFVAGNHDSPEIINKMSSKPGVIVLDEETIEINSISIMGLADPAARSSEMTSDLEAINSYQIKLEELYYSADQKPDIIAIHQRRIAEGLIGKVPVLLHGHNHRLEIDTDDTVVINAGTTGAAGIRGLQSEDDIPYSVALLHYDVSNERSKKELKFIDIIKFYTRHGGFIMERKLIH